jgi:hypothetical protein
VVLGTVSGTIRSFGSIVTSQSGIVLDVASAASINALALSYTVFTLLSGTSTLVNGNGDSNITVSAAIDTCRINNPGAAPILVGVGVTNLKWVFIQTPQLIETDQAGVVSLTNNATATVITTVNVPVQIAGTWALNEQLHYSASAAGRLTYIGLVSSVVNIDAVVTVLAAVGAAINIMTLELRVNDAVVASQQFSADNANPQSCPIVWRRLMETGDYVELWISNNTDADDLIVRNAVLRAD